VAFAICGPGDLNQLLAATTAPTGAALFGPPRNQCSERAVFIDEIMNTALSFCTPAIGPS
jgi:hypothetical protein